MIARLDVMIDAGLTNGVPWSIQVDSDIKITVRTIPERKIEKKGSNLM